MEKNRRSIDPAWVILMAYLALFAGGIAQRAWGFEGEVLLDFLPVTCPFRVLTGWLCPGCGLTHAFLALSRFDLAAALTFHPFSPLVFIGAFGWSTVQLLRRQPLSRNPPLSPATLGILFTTILAFWLLRNL